MKTRRALTPAQCVFVVLVVAAWPAAAPAQDAPSTANSQPAASEDPKFDILEFQIEGNTVLPALAIEKAVYPHLGFGRGIKDVEQARAALEKAYQAAGFLTVLVDIPEQKVDAGIVRLAVTEGRVGKVRVTGARYYSRGVIRSRAPALAAGTVPFFPDVQEQLGKLSRSPDRRITPVLKPGAEPGAVDVELKVEDKLPLHAGIELNNRQSANTEPLRLQVFARYDNLWQREHSIGVQAQISPQDISQVRVFSGTYLLPVAATGDLLALYAVQSRSDVAAVGDVTVLGNGTIVGARYILPLRSAERFNHSMTLGVDYKNFEDSVKLLGADSIETPIQYTPMLVQYTMNAVGDKGTTQANAGVNFALRGAFGNEDADFENKRFNAHANYFYLRGEVERKQVLPKSFELIGRVEGQLAGQPLISNEQYPAGGADSVRGYLEAEVLGDDGVRGSLELRHPIDVHANWLQELTGLAFIEGASLSVRDPLPGQESRFDISSAGVGLRLRAYQTMSAALDVAWPFEDAQETKKGDTRVHFRVAYEF